MFMLKSIIGMEITLLLLEKNLQYEEDPIGILDQDI